jgi:hypothetical protein
MAISNDFKELFILFNDQGVEYLIVGGYALAFHGAPRFTGDIDVPVKYIGYDQFIKNKRAIGRHKDLADIDAITRSKD